MEEVKKQYKTFFILGVPRSGTTLLSVLLNNHSEIYIPQVSFLGKILEIPYKLQNQIKRGEKIDFNSIWNSVERLKNVRSLSEEDSVKDLSIFFEDTLTSVAKKNNKVIWGDKAPPAVDRMDEINMLFPNSKFIHVVRDPRANALSLQNRQNMNLLVAADYWYELNSKGIIQGNILGNDKYMLVRYEDILSNPEATLKRVCCFLGVPFTYALVDNLSKSKDTNIENAYVKKRLDVSKIDQWKKDLSQRKISKIERQCIKLMDKFEYSSYTSRVRYKRLSSSMFILLSMTSIFKRLFQSKVKHMKGRSIEIMSIPLNKRFQKFISETTSLVFSSKFKEIFKYK